VSYDPIARTPYLCYGRGGDRRILFFEDAESFSEKLLLLEEFGLAGITLYPTVLLPAPLLSLLAYRYRIVKSSC
jgi:spore germination protein YaaH